MSFYPADKPTINDDGSLRIVFPIEGEEKGLVTLTFSEVEQSKGTVIDALLLAVIHLGEQAFPFSGHINLLSLSSRETFARQLGKSLKKKLPVELYLSRGIEAVLQHQRTAQTAIWLEEAPPTTQDKWLLEPFLLDGSPNIIFGKGGGGKTFLALRLLLATVTGTPFMGMTPIRKVKALFLDYEDTSANGLDRIYKLCGGEFKPELDDVFGKIRYFRASGIPLHDLIPALREEIQRNEIGLILIDSAALACGGEPEKAESALRFFNALSKLDVTSLIIAHETKAETHEYVFGSVFFHNSARNIWNIQSEPDEQDKSIIHMGLFHRKCNHGAMQQPKAIRIFHGTGFVDIGAENIGRWESGMSVPQRILKLLKFKGMVLDDLRNEMPDVKIEPLKVALSRMKKEGKIDQNGSRWELAK